MTRRGRSGGLGGLAILVGAAWLGGPGLAVAAGPVGSLVVDCTGIEGWAQEPDMPDALIDVHLYFGGPAGDPAASAVVVTADEVLDAGCVGAECMHGYRSALPMALLDGADHAVHAYGIDLTGDPNLELAGSPAVLSCPRPPIVSGERRHIVSPEILGAWSFSVFFDRLTVADVTIAGLPEALPVDVGPQLRVDDGGGLWIVDAGFRRPVPPDVVPAWRLDPAAALPLTPEELVLPEGTPLRPRPILLQGTMPEVYLLDDHQCLEGDPHPDCAPPPEGDTGGGDETGSDETGAGPGPGDDESEGDAGESGSGSGSGGTGATVPGAPALEDDDDSGCACRGGGRREGRGEGWGALLLVLLASVRRRGRGLP